MKLVFATNNLNKVKELQSLIPSHITILSLEDIGCKENIPETQDTIEGNAMQKSAYVKRNYGYDCFADDTGLEVESLNNEPGVYSARYAGEQRSAKDNMDLLLKKLKDKPNRNARFKTVISLELNGATRTFTGLCEGEITTEKKGTDGFGYDPIFKPHNYNETFAEMDLSLKNNIGHRGKAVRALVEYLNNI
ncbi:non-canonical purine NTP diphosphatase [Aurantibacter aestuarii]|uniref:dITP/XTP pyrophosphatase n=1 Tax=Aurantibacter aestuarii TaxID=1266046 RepID=A0A2T1NBD8_9FLAO|nr:non-canonical purine NTP diphosphatase [Aurantibacter aestuarii]PSG89459.1 non-canonical purine NTP pyrophosphatase [Aurantibacter aestuarii]